MIDTLYLRISTLDVAAARQLMARVDELIDDRIDEARSWLMSRGWTEIDMIPSDAITAPDKRRYMPDGREIMPAQGKLWALSPEEHKRRIAANMAAKRAGQERDKPTLELPPETCTAIIDGQLCGGTLKAKHVCPKCSLGRHGVAATLTCDVCGAVTAIMSGGK
jgi:hypothetical protein